MKRIRDIAPMATGVRDLESARRAIAQLEDRWREVVNHDHDGQSGSGGSSSTSSGGGARLADVEDADSMTFMLMGA